MLDQWLIHILGLLLYVRSRASSRATLSTVGLSRYEFEAAIIARTRSPICFTSLTPWTFLVTLFLVSNVLDHRFLGDS